MKERESKADFKKVDEVIQEDYTPISKEINEKSKIITFYSYKGGVGRSMALANVAYLLAEKYHYKVIVIDWDLEAPGLNKFFNIDERKIKTGLIDMFYDFKNLMMQDISSLEEDFMDIGKYIIKISDSSPNGGSISIIPAGNNDAKYASMVNNFDWDDFYENWHGFGFIEYLKKQLKKRANIIILDSRTGITDIGGVCTLQMPDVVVLLFSLNEQGISGTEMIIKSILRNSIKATDQKTPPQLIIVPSRVEKYLEKKIKDEWERKSAERFAEYLPEKEKENALLYIKKKSIPYVGFYSFGEMLAVKDDPYGDLSESLEELAKMILVASGFQILLVTPVVRQKTEYVDFELEIESGRGLEYPVAVRSPAGEAHGIMHFPFDDLVLESRLKDIKIAIAHSGLERYSSDEQIVIEFGQSLFDALLNGELRSCYDVSRLEATNQGKGLRLKLHINPQELAALPWEFLYDSRQANYVSLSRRTPVVRYLDMQQPIQPLTITPPLHILGMIATPPGSPSLDVERGKQRVNEAIKNLQGAVDITWLKGQTWRDLHAAMWEGPWHVFYFIGHGGFDNNTNEGLITLVDDNGNQAFRLSATKLGQLLAGHDSMRLVLLNSCEGARSNERDVFSSTATILVRQGIPAVLAMQYEISDKAAVEFARTFYGALAKGLPVDAAATEARIAVNTAFTNTLEWGTPVLYMRSRDGILFNIRRR